jgi:hypothetical protein
MIISKHIGDAINAVCPNATWSLDEPFEYANLRWMDEVNAKPSEQDVMQKYNELLAQVPFDACKQKAKELIAATDWAALPDVGLQNKSAFEAYRAALRALIITPVAEPVWPTEPTPIWE